MGGRTIVHVFPRLRIAKKVTAGGTFRGMTACQSSLIAQKTPLQKGGCFLGDSMVPSQPAPVFSRQRRVSRTREKKKLLSLWIGFAMLRRFILPQTAKALWGILGPIWLTTNSLWISPRVGSLVTNVFSSSVHALYKRDSGYQVSLGCKDSYCLDQRSLTNKLPQH